MAEPQRATGRGGPADLEDTQPCEQPGPVEELCCSLALLSTCEDGAAADTSAAAAATDLVVLHILRCAALSDVELVHARLVSKTFRELADLVLQERFTARWGVAGVSEPPPAVPAYAATRPSFVLCHALRGRESLAALAVRYGADTVALKRLNNLLSDGALLSRTHLFVPVDPAAAAASKRVAFVQDEHSKRRLIVLVEDGEELPAPLAGRGAGGHRPHRGSDQAFVVEKLAAVLQRALRIDNPTATFYVQQARCDVRAAIEKYEEDRQWERCMARSAKARGLHFK